MVYRGRRMPPGAMGWPFVGETLDFLTQGPDFMKGRRSRYGNLFKTHALGSPIIVSMDPDVNRYILMNEAKGLVPGYPDSMRKILGNNIAEVHGLVHKRIRGSLLSLIGPIAVKDRLLLESDEFMRSNLDNWDGKIIDVQQKSLEMSFFVSMKAVVENESTSFLESFKSIFDNIKEGTISLPIKIPGTKYYRGLKAREKVVAILEKLIAKRRASQSTHDDILDRLIRNEDVKHKLNDEEIIDQIITILYSGYETVSITTMMAIKYLTDYPRVLQGVRDEHFAIQQRKMPEELITWDDYKNMSFTRAVIFETMRLASVVSGVLRRTTTDIELNGFIIPKGWRVYSYTRETNLDPFLYQEPFTFNPWRWLENGLESHNHNMLFGAGGRVCPGKEWGILKISLFLHYFVTKYRWEEVKGNELLKFPRVLAPKGLHINITKY
ncbi:cytochrome P450 85A-like [Abrus precatorius]|uniref:Cytochrome P450 85A-like n=1 Tax=Abrus precatorius TaxID=3816 RepID=A0A8B8M1I0_ABRPR|nr:cytochrome P450 85A-like [Abrus precatorius]